MARLKLTYFDFHGGRGEPARLALAIGGIDFEDDRVPFADWPRRKPGTPFGGLPVLDEIAKDYQGKLKVCKLNIDENQDTPPKYGVRGIPTLMLFKNGNVEATKVGALSKSQLAAFLDANI